MNAFLSLAHSSSHDTFDCGQFEVIEHMCAGRIDPHELKFQRQQEKPRVNFQFPK